MNKYRNQKVYYNGAKIDSKKEARRLFQLKLLEKANEIEDLRTQVQFELQPSFEKNGKKYRAITYIADFVYYDNKLKRVVIEDTKGYKTEVYKLKKKLFEYKYPNVEIEEI